MDVHLRDLRYFVGVAEELSFTRAAEHLMVSQPALSKQIRQLESMLGFPLFERDRRRVSLTPAGSTLLTKAKQLVDDWDTAVEHLEQLVAAEKQTLTVGMLTSLGRDLYPSIARVFADRQPGWRLVLHMHDWSDATAGLADRSTDVAFVWLPVGDARIAHSVLVSERRWVALGRGHWLATQEEIDFADFADEPFIALPRSAGALRDFWLAMDARADGRPARIAAEAATAEEKFELIAAGAAVGLLSEGNVALYARPDIVCRPVRGLAPSLLAVGWRREDRRPAVHAFVQACRDVVREHGASEARAVP
ncbi:MAG: LysR family transcriptional regulator [Chloroflexi bacterium]|nr:LysR family transcriptional regulator [Chloroflexota bacterium]